MMRMTEVAMSRRAWARKTVVRPSTLRIDAAQPLDVIVEDLSAAGFCFFSEEPIPVGTSIRVGLAGPGQADAEVTWREGKRHGSQFTSALTQSTIDAAFSNDRVGITATIGCKPSIPTATTKPVHLAQEYTLNEGVWRIEPFFGFVLAMLAGGLCWKAVAVLLHQL